MGRFDLLSQGVTGIVHPVPNIYCTTDYILRLRGICMCLFGSKVPNIDKDGLLNSHQNNEGIFDMHPCWLLERIHCPFHNYTDHQVSDQYYLSASRPYQANVATNVPGNTCMQPYLGPRIYMGYMHSVPKICQC